MINIGRKTMFGNPVRLGRRCPICDTVHRQPGDTQVCFKKYLEARWSGEPWALLLAQSVWQMPAPAPDVFRRNLLALRGQVLKCPGCGVGAPGCHGRVIERFLRQVAG